MSDYLKGVLSVPALALGLCVLVICFRIFLALSDRLIEIGVMRLTKESTKHQRAAIASATYSAPRSWTLAGRSVGITFFVGMNADDLIWAANPPYGEGDRTSQDLQRLREAHAPG